MASRRPAELLASELPCDNRNVFEVRIGCALAVLVVCGCGRSNPDVIRDTTGATFDWSCDEDGCTVTERGDTPPPIQCGPDEAHYGYAHSRFVDVCAGGLAEQCRLVVCDSDEECPQWEDDEFECQHGLCQHIDSEDLPLDPISVTALCFDETPRPDVCMAAARDPDVAAVVALVNGACPVGGSECSVPSSCRQP